MMKGSKGKHFCFFHSTLVVKTNIYRHFFSLHCIWWKKKIVISDRKTCKPLHLLEVLCRSGSFIVSPHSDRLAVPFCGGQTFDKEVSQVMFRDGSSFQHVLGCHVILRQRKIIYRGPDRDRKHETVKHKGESSLIQN